MKKVLAILLFAVLLTTTIFGYAVAQNKADSRMIDMEKRKLQDELQRYKDSHTQERFDRLNINKSRQDGPSKEDRIQSDIDLLDRDPDLYFYKKYGANTRTTTGGVVNRNNSNVGQSNSNWGPCMGDCASEQGICNSQCQGNGQCINTCAAAHGRCVSRCR